MKHQHTWFEVETTYKSGRKRTNYYKAFDENEMWRNYDKCHNKDLIESSSIVDAWPA